MSIIVERNNKIDKMYSDGARVIGGVAGKKVTKKFLLDVKTKQKVIMANKLLKNGLVDYASHFDYIKKVKKERELAINEEGKYEELIHESSMCNMGLEYKNGSIKYFVDQCGMRQYYDEESDALKDFVMILI